MTEFEQIDNTTFQISSEEVRRTIVGDQKKLTFEPVIEIVPWEDEEDCLKIYKDISVSTQKSVDLADKAALKWQDSKEPWLIQPLGGYIPDGIKSPYNNWNGAQFIINLAVKPKIDPDGYVRFPFKIEGHQSMRFCPQPGVGHPHMPSWGTPDWCYDSIAVYHKTKWNSRKGHTYKTGKICHIMRPWCLDNLGNFTWGKWGIDETAGVLVKIIPAIAFSYPGATSWKVDATFGNSAQGGSLENNCDDTILGTAEGGWNPSGNATVNSLHCWMACPASFTTRNAAMCIYEADLDLVTNGGTDQQAISEGLNQSLTFTYTTPPSILAATAYELAVWNPGEAGDAEPYRDYVSNAGTWDLDTDFPNWPDPWPASASGNRYSLWCTYTESGGGASVVPILRNQDRRRRI